MYKHSLRKDKIKAIAVGTTRILGVSEKFVIDIDSDEILIEAEDSLQGIHFSNDIFYTNDIYGRGYLIQLDGTTDKLNDFTIISVLNKYRILVSDQENTYALDLNNKEAVQLINARIFTFLLEKDYLYYKHKKKIKAADINRNELNWEFDISSFGQYKDKGENKDYEIKKVLGVWSGILIVQLSGFRIIGIDIKTGGLKQDLDLKGKFATEPGNYLSNTSPIHYHAKDDCLIWLSNSSLIKIELKSFTPHLITNFFTNESGKLWRFNKSEIMDSQLYFTGDYGMEFVVSTRIGVIDIATGKVLWQTQLKKTGGLSTNPIIYKDKLLLLGSKYTLDIFERMNNYATQQ